MHWLTTLPAFVRFSLLPLALALAMLVVGSLGAVHHVLFSALFLTAIGYQLVACVFAVRYLYLASSNDNLATRLMLLLSVLLFGYALISGMLLPTTARDALVHHIFVAQHWAHLGTIQAIRGHDWSHYPQLLQVFFTGAAQLGVLELTVFTHASYALLTAALVAYVCAKHNLSAGFGAAIVLLTPIVLQLSSEPLVDLGLMYAATLSIAGLILGWNASVIGFALAMAICIKPNGLLVTVVVLPFLLAAPKRLMQVILWTAVAYLPWGIWCFFASGNPIYPAATSFFGPAALADSPSLFSGFTPLEQRVFLYGESLLYAISLPVRIFLEGREGSPQFFDGALAPVTLISLAALFFKNTPHAVQKCLAIAFGYIVLASLLTVMRVRYLIPVIAPLAIATSFVFTRYRTLQLFVLALSLVVAVAHYFFLDRSLSITWATLRGAISSEEYLALKIPEYPVIRFINEMLPHEAKVLLVLTGNQFSLYHRQVMASGHNSAQALLDPLLRSGSKQELQERLRSQGITHILVEKNRFFSLLESKEELRVKKDLFKSSFQPMYETRGFVVAEFRQ